MTANVHTAAAVQGLLETTSAPILSSSATVTTAAAAAATNAGTTADSSSSLLSSLLPTQLSTTQMAGGAAALCGAAALVIGYRRLGRRKTAGGSGEKGEKDNAPQSTEALSNDPSLIRKHTQSISITTDHGFTYPNLRIFYRPHPKAELLPPKLPLIVFLHGLGGQLQQFQYLLEYYVHVSHVLAIDLPGCGASKFAPKNWEAYTTPALCSLIAKTVDRFREEHQQVVIVGHSMGCALGVTLCTKGGLMEPITAGFVAISPKAVVTEHDAKNIANVTSIPELAFDVFRMWDRRGGTRSKSVARMVGKNASEGVRRLQLRFNQESRTPVWLRMVSGVRLPSREDWQAVRCPILLLGAVEDRVTTIQELDEIHGWFDPTKRKASDASTSLESSDGESDLSVSSAGTATTQHVKKCIVPSAGHAVLIEAHQLVCGLMGEFLSRHVDEVLSLGWQLSYLKEDKWMLKNLKKWESIQSVSPRIIRRASEKRGRPEKVSPFRAMKTLRQNDEHGHNPIEFSRRYPDVKHVVDISHEQPPYDPQTLGSQVEYHKYSTVSKIPPTKDEVAGFISLIDSIRSTLSSSAAADEATIAVHCHYGFNRTGFLVCCYLVERCGFSVVEAICSFKEARPPGIRHPHFISELHERYTEGLLRTPTF